MKVNRRFSVMLPPPGRLLQLLSEELESTVKRAAWLKALCLSAENNFLWGPRQERRARL